MDFLTDYDGIREQLAAMARQVSTMDDINRQLLAAANGLPGAALGGRALVSYVEYLQGVSNRLGALLNHANLLTQTASRAVSEIESADNTLRQRAPALP